MALNEPDDSAAETALRELADALARAGGGGEISTFLREILTPAELRDIALRWRLLQRLHAGVAQRVIARELGISLCKITRGSRELRNPNSVIRRLLDQSGEAE